MPSDGTPDEVVEDSVEERRGIRVSKLRAKLDACSLLMYGLSRHDAEYVLDTFPIVRRNDQRMHGEFRTKRLILERFNAMAKAVVSGQPYKTVLEPPPADPRVAHQDDPLARGRHDAIQSAASKEHSPEEEP